MRKYQGMVPDVNVLALLELHLLMKYVNKLANTVNLDDPSKTPNAGTAGTVPCPNTHARTEELDEMTLHTMVRQKAWASSCREMFESAIRIIFGAELKEISLLYFLWYTKSAGGIEPLIDSKAGGQVRG